jgi:hypothetical protein
MSPIALSSISFLCIVGGIALGALLRRALPERHLSGDAKDVVRLGAGLVGTIAALVLGLLIASAKSSFDTQNTEVKQLTANILLLDLVLAEYGTETQAHRELMRRGVDKLVDRVWRDRRSAGVAAPFEATNEGEALDLQIQSLAPRNDAQRSLRERAVKIATDIAQTRLLLFTQTHDTIPMPFLAVLVFWLTIIFASFSLFAQPSPTVIGALLIFALSATGAIYLILELSQPFSGLMQIASDQLRNALAPLSR